MIVCQIFTAFFASGVSFVRTRKSAFEEIAGKLNLDSRGVSHWRNRTELFHTHRFSGFYRSTSNIVHTMDQNPHFPVAK